jgi:hypothetical protein
MRCPQASPLPLYGTVPFPFMYLPSFIACRFPLTLSRAARASLEESMCARENCTSPPRPIANTRLDPSLPFDRLLDLQLPFLDRLLSRKQANVSPPTSSSPPSDRSVAAWEECLPPSRRRTSSSSDSGLPCPQAHARTGRRWARVDCTRLEWRYGTLARHSHRFVGGLIRPFLCGEVQEDSGRWSSARLLSLLTFAVRPLLLLLSLLPFAEL